MKDLKKVIVTLIVIMMFSSTKAYSTPSNEDVDNLLINEDLIVSTWAKQGVYGAWVDELLVNSSLESNSNLTLSATREEVTEIAYNYVVKTVPQFRREHLVSINGNLSFKDTHNGKILELARFGLVNGKEKSMFYPNDKITREEVATIMYRVELLVWGSESLDSPIGQLHYKDKSKVSGYAIEPIRYFTHKEQLNGTGGNYFSPKQEITREQVAIFIYRLYMERLNYEIINNQ